MTDYPPYVNAYGKIPAVFDSIRKAEKPPKFNQDFLETVLGYKSSSDRAFIPFLKRIGLIDAGNVPTKDYDEFRDESSTKIVLAKLIRQAYAEIYKVNQYAHKLKKEDLIQTMKRVTGVSEGDQVLPAVVATFQALVAQANFESEKAVEPKSAAQSETRDTPVSQKISPRFGLSYTINLNLPATTNVEVFNAIFKALKENLLDGD